jgi:cyclic pyranopterin phosphate synthase
VSSRLIDTFGRVHSNLRVSVTDRCNLRCTYCMPEEVEFLPRAELLTFEEIVRVVRVAIGLGVVKVRLTGGEPLLRRDLEVLTAMLAELPGLADLSLTTNGLLLEAQAEALYAAGLRRLNISLDTLRPERFRQLARREGLDKVLAGIEAARRLGFHPIKLNAVCIRGVNDDDIVPLAHFARERGLEMRFIEYMPIGAEPWQRAQVLYAHEILELLEAAFGPLFPAPDYDPRNPAMEFCYADGQGRVGFIASVSRPFCRHCNRLRLTADGKLRNCLFALQEHDLKTLLRHGGSDDDLQQVFRDCVHDKWEGHEINTARFLKPLRTMHAIGG